MSLCAQCGRRPAKWHSPLCPGCEDARLSRLRASPAYRCWLEGYKAKIHGFVAIAREYMGEEYNKRDHFS